MAAENTKEVAGYGKGVNADYLCFFPILTSGKHNLQFNPACSAISTPQLPKVLLDKYLLILKIKRWRGGQGSKIIRETF